MSTLKRSSEVNWDDLTKIESPFFAASAVKSDFNEISGLAEIKDNGTFMSQTIDSIITSIEFGSLFLVVSKPFCPIIKWTGGDRPGVGVGDFVPTIHAGSFSGAEMLIRTVKKPAGINFIKEFASISTKAIRSMPEIADYRKAKDEAKAEELCPHCGELKTECEKHKNPKKGNIIGTGTDLRKSIFDKRGREQEDHPWYTGRHAFEAHHIISTACMKKGKWKVYCNQIGYDINHEKNGVILPYHMKNACQIHAPMHRSNHSLGFAFDVNLSYPDAVKMKLREVKKVIISGKFCEIPEALLNDLNVQSEKILVKIDEFIWTITKDGRDYAYDGLGCGGQKSINARKHRCYREHDLKQFRTGEIIPIKNRPLKIGE